MANPVQASFRGVRVQDVRVQIAKLGDGLARVEAHHAGSYTIYTQDGRSWSVEHSERAGVWTGEEKI